jgi:hypothetical protein
MDNLLAKHDEEALIIRSDDTSSCRRIFQARSQIGLAAPPKKGSEETVHVRAISVAGSFWFSALSLPGSLPEGDTI